MLTVEGILDACKAPRAAAFEGSLQALPNRLVCILTYDGDGLDVIINYVLLIVNLLVCVAQLRAGGIHHDDTQNEHQRQSRGRAVKAAAALVFVVAFQLVLCLAVGCVGISVVWCAMMGWIACERIIGAPRQQSQPALLRQPETDPIVHRDESESSASADATFPGARAELRSARHPSRPSDDFQVLDFLIFSALAVDLVGIVYYGVVMPAITTVAHVCAIALGSLCWWISVWKSRQ
jgi:nitrate reductase NapE component